MKNPRNKNKESANSFIRYSSLGFEMMAIIGGGTFAGYKIDDWLNNDFRIFTLCFCVCAVVISILYGVKNLLKPPGNANQK